MNTTDAGWAAVARAPSLHADQLQAALRECGSVAELAALGAQELQARGVGPAAAGWLAAPDERLLAEDLEWLQRSGVQLVPFTSPLYPPQLRAIPSAPPVLYVRGAPEVLRHPQLAMVGSRNPTAAGARTARDFAAHLARCGLAITSGLARGIDAACHEGALQVDGLTLAVCGTGLDSVYPPQHAALAERIAASGALVSELPPRTAPRPHNFPQRNRIISGLARGTLVVEAARGSGSLITAKLAGEHGRAVLAIPGSIHSPLSRGCHQLIREGARLVDCAADVLQELNIPLEEQILGLTRVGPVDAAGEAPALDKDYEMLLDALGFEPASVDMLVDRTGLPGESVASMLLILELAGRIEPRAGGRYCRTWPSQGPQTNR